MELRWGGYTQKNPCTWHTYQKNTEVILRTNRIWGLAGLRVFFTFWERVLYNSRGTHTKPNLGLAGLRVFAAWRSSGLFYFSGESVMELQWNTHKTEFGIGRSSGFLWRESYSIYIVDKTPGTTCANEPTGYEFRLYSSYKHCIN